MPIIDNNVKVSIEFKYSDENINGKCMYDVSCENINNVNLVKITKTFYDERAANIYWSEENFGGEVFSVQMIEDIYNFLISKGLISPKEDVKNVKLPANKLPNPSLPLPLPNIVDKISYNDEPAMNLENKNNKTSGVQSLKTPVQPAHEISNEELAEITARRKTMPKGKNSEKSIKRRDILDEEE